MASDICPNCGAITQDTDTQCMDCGVDIETARRKVAEKTLVERGGTVLASEPIAAEGAGAGLAEAGETSDKVRLKEFDKQLATKLAQERGAVMLTAVIALVIGAVVLVVGLGALKNAGGMEAIKALDFNDLRSRGLGMLGDPTLTSILILLSGVAGLLCATGQTRRFMLAGRAIAQVKRGERPEVVHISTWTHAGLLLLSVTAAPLGLILGIMFKFGRDDETKALGGTMLRVSIVVIGLVVLSVVWNMVAGFAASKAPVNAVTSGAGLG